MHSYKRQVKPLLIKALALFFAPFKVGSRNYFRVKDIYYTSPSDHFYQTLHHVKRIVGDDKKFNVILDIGAANGESSKFFKEHFPSSIVIGFEPNHAMFKYLDSIQKSTQDLEFRKVALGSSSKQINLNITANNYSSSTLEISQDESSPDSEKFKIVEQIEVAQSTLDAELPNINSILLIKIDTQGSELEIFKGGIETLRKTKFILVELMNHELYTDSPQYYDIDNFLRINGFSLLDIIVTYRSPDGLKEFDALYQNPNI